MTTIDDRSGSASPMPLDAAVLTMDVADTLRNAPELTAATDPVAALRDVYASVGLSVSDAVLSDGLAAHRDNRFTYAVPSKGLGPGLAQLYVGRKRWLPGMAALGLVGLVAVGGYSLVYRPYRVQQSEQARVELEQAIPARIDALYRTIFDETKVQQAANDAAAIRDRGKAAAAGNDRAAAEQAVDDLTALRDRLRADYRLGIVTGAEQKWGFWTFPSDNSEETNFYLVVEARDAEGNVVTLPVKDDATGQIDKVAVWGIQVPEETYRAVEADKTDDGVIEHPLVGIKQFGFLVPDYLVAVLGGAVTRW